MDFYRARFQMNAINDPPPDFFGELILYIQIWLKKRYGGLVSKFIPDWSAFISGGIFGSPEYTKNSFFIESISDDTKLNSQKSSWACKITEYFGDKQFFPRKWITEIGYQLISNKTADISYSVKYEDQRGISHPQRQNIPNIAKSLLTSNNWICTVNGSRIDANIANYKAFEGNLFGVEDCRVLASQHNNSLMSPVKNIETAQSKSHWVSLCKVNHPDRNQDIWMVRLADVVNGILIAPIFDKAKEQIFENRLMIFHNDGPSDPDNIGFWEWTERQNSSGRWLSDATYIEHSQPIEIVVYNDLTSVGKVVERLKTGVYIQTYIRGKVLFSIKNNGCVKGLLCNLNDFKVRPGRNLIDIDFTTIKDNIYTLPYYEVCEQDVFTFKDRNGYNRKVYNHLSLGAPKKQIAIYPFAETIKQILLQRMKWQIFKAQGITKNDWKKFRQFLSQVADDSIIEELSKMYDLSLQDSQAHVDAFLKNVENYVDVKDVDSSIIAKMIENHEGLKRKCDEYAYNRWCCEHKAEIVKAQDETTAIRTQAEQEIEIAGQRLLDIEKSISSAQAERNNILLEITEEQDRLNDLHAAISQYKALEKDTLEAVQQKIGEAQKNVAEFIASLSMFMPQSNFASVHEKNNTDWQYICANQTKYLENDIDLAEDWQDEFHMISQNLSGSLKIDPNDPTLCMLTAFLYSAHINNSPMLIVGPNGSDFADALSVSIYASDSGCLQLGNECDYNIADKIKDHDERIITIQNMFGKSWNDNLPQSFSKLKNQIIWTHPYVEDMIIEPKGLYNYMIPILSECFIKEIPSLDLCPGKRADNFREYTPLNPSRNCHFQITAFKRLGLSKLLLNNLSRILFDAKTMLGDPAKEKDMEILFGLLPLCVLTGKSDVLRELVEEKNGISGQVKTEIMRYIEED